MLWLTALVLAGEPDPDPFMVGCDNTDKALIAAYNDAVAAFNAGDMKGTRAATDKVLKRAPACKGALVLGISARIRLVDDDGPAMAARAMAAYPKDPEFPAMLADMAFVAQAFDVSLEAALKARALDPSHQQAAHAAFYAYMRLGRYDEALALASEYPGYDSGGRDCLRIEVLIDQDRVADAKQLRESCAGSTSDIAEHAIAFLDAQSGATDAAVGLAADHGVSSQALFTLAAQHFQREEYPQARELLERAIQIEPWNAFIRINLAMAYIYTGQRAKAKKELQALYEADTWVTQWQSGAVSGVVTKGVERDLEEGLKLAFGQLVILLVDEGDIEEAGVALRKAEARFGRIAPLAAPAVRYTRATEGPREGWVAMDRALAAFPGEDELVHEAGRMAFADAPGMPASVGTTIAARGNDDDHQNLVVGYSNAKMYADCSRVGLPLLPAPGTSSALPGLVYGCALSARDLVAAEQVARGREGTLDAGNRVYHGYLLLDAGRPAEALALVRAVNVPAQRRDDVIVNSYRKLGQLEDAIAAAKGATLEPSTRYNLGLELYEKERKTDLAAVVAGLDCALLPEVAKDCRRLLDAAK